MACGEVASERVILSTSTSLKPNAKRKKNSKSKKLKQRILRDHESKKTMRKMKHLSSIANDVVQRCSQYFFSPCLYTYLQIYVLINRNYSVLDHNQNHGSQTIYGISFP